MPRSMAIPSAGDRIAARTATISAPRMLAWMFQPASRSVFGVERAILRSTLSTGAPARSRAVTSVVSSSTGLSSAGGMHFAVTRRTGTSSLMERSWRGASRLLQLLMGNVSTARADSTERVHAKRVPRLSSAAESSRRSRSVGTGTGPPAIRTSHFPHVPRPPQTAAIGTLALRAASRSVSPGSTTASCPHGSKWTVQVTLLAGAGEFRLS